MPLPQTATLGLHLSPAWPKRGAKRKEKINENSSSRLLLGRAHSSSLLSSLPLLLLLLLLSLPKPLEERLSASLSSLSLLLLLLGTALPSENHVGAARDFEDRGRKGSGGGGGGGWAPWGQDSGQVNKLSGKSINVERESTACTAAARASRKKAVPDVLAPGGVLQLSSMEPLPHCVTAR